jgi:hypothetical protein
MPDALIILSLQRAITASFGGDGEAFDIGAQNDSEHFDDVFSRVNGWERDGDDSGGWGLAIGG